MKNQLGFVLLFFPALMATGQVTYNDSREDFLMAMQRNKSFRQHIVAGNITSIQTFGYSHNKVAACLMYEARYDKEGNNTDWFRYRKGKIKQHNTTDFDDSNRVIKFATYGRSGKLKTMLTTTYDKSGNPVEQDFFKRNPQTICTKTSKTYNSRSNITETKVFDRNGALKNRIEYTYYDDGSKKQTVEYNGSGKVKRIWNFDCNPVGIQEAKKFKDTSKICIRYETDKDGNPIKIKEEYSGAGGLGRTTRNVTKYDKNNNMIDVSSYNLKGKQLTHWSAAYNTSGSITEFTYYKAGTQKIWYKITYSYNTDGNMAESITYKKSTIPYYTRKYVYTSSITVPAK